MVYSVKWNSKKKRIKESKVEEKSLLRKTIDYFTKDETGRIVAKGLVALTLAGCTVGCGKIYKRAKALSIFPEIDLTTKQTKPTVKGVKKNDNSRKK